MEIIPGLRILHLALDQVFRSELGISIPDNLKVPLMLKTDFI